MQTKVFESYGKFCGSSVCNDNTTIQLLVIHNTTTVKTNVTPTIQNQFELSMCINLSQYLTLKSHRATFVERSFASMAGQLQTACGDVVTICLEDHVQSFTTDMEYK